MKKLFLFVFVVFLFTGCKTDEMDLILETAKQNMKEVTLSAGMNGPETKASVASDGNFSWQSNDEISVLATDGKFYLFTLSGGEGEGVAEFTGQIPEDAQITTVALYPALVADGTDNTICSNGQLNYTLPSEYTYKEGVTNVPMVASFEEGATYVSFRQIGGVMRFPVKNMPPEAKFVLTAKDKTITGAFPVNLGSVGSASISAGNSESTVTVNYVSDTDGKDVELNIPVPTSVYNNFNVKVTDADGAVIFTKDYSKENKVERATLLIMKELQMPEHPMTIKDVWPFFVDARIVFAPVANAQKYALFIDGEEEPSLIADNVENLDRILFGGQFTMNSEHKIAIAKVVDDTVVEQTKTAPYTFTTGNIWQNRTNVGTKFVSVGWTNVATSESNDNHREKGYYVELYASNDLSSAPIHSMIAFCGQTETFQNCFSNSSWIGKSETDVFNNGNVPMPTALSFGFLEPNTSYWFRVRTLDGEYDMNEENDNYDPLIKTPYILKSQSGGCAFSPLFQLTTEPVHVAGSNEIFHEGFDDLTLNSDFMNMCPGVVPLFATAKSDLLNNDGDDYSYGIIKDKYKAFYQLGQSEKLAHKYTMQTHQTGIRFDQFGMMASHGNKKNSTEEEREETFNEYSGSLKGWKYAGTSTGSSGNRMYAYPGFGFLRIGRGGKTTSCSVTTPPIESSALRSDIGTKCIVTLQVCGYESNKENIVGHVGLLKYTQNLSGAYEAGASQIIDYSSMPDWQSNMAWVSATEYKRNYKWYTVDFEVYLKNKDYLQIRKESSTDDTGFLVLGDIKVVVCPGEYDTDERYTGTAPDNTDYDAYNMDGELPISFWWAPPASAYTKTDANGASYYDAAVRKQLYQDIKDAGINVVNYIGWIDQSLSENKNIMNVCKELGLKFIGNTAAYHDESGNLVSFSTAAERVAKIKENFAGESTYVAEYLDDEPGANEFAALAEFVNEYNKELPDKDVYINLFPDYARTSDSEKDQLNRASYELYLDEYLATCKVDFISYDYYCLNNNAGDIKASYYTNLDMMRAKTLALRKPFWLITQAGDINGSTREPNEKEERWSVWSALALGSKGIAYFCYWTPVGFPDYMIDLNGEKTERYTWVKQINLDINTIGKKLMPCHADGAIMTATKYYPLYYNNGAGLRTYGPILKVEGTISTLCGCFRDARTAYASTDADSHPYKGYKALITHQMPARGNFSVNVTLDSSISEITFTHNNTEQKISLANMTDTSVGLISIAYTNGTLTLGIPEGEAVLLEF